MRKVNKSRQASHTTSIFYSTLTREPDIQLVKNNASVGSDIATELSRLQQGTSEGESGIKRHDGKVKQSMIQKQQKRKDGPSEVVMISY